MAFAQSGLRKVAENLFIYNATADAVATVIASGYFNSAYKQLKLADVILIIGSSNTTIDVAFVNSATNATTVTTIAAEGVTGT